MAKKDQKCVEKQFSKCSGSTAMEWKGGEDTRASRAEGGHQRDRVCYCSCVGGKDRLRWFGHALGWDSRTENIAEH